ncbi:MAG: ABC transporter ATP-binding protein, partial [Mesorhizobium sp.]
DISPARGEIGCRAGFANLRRCRTRGAQKPLISPLAGEMAGRPEGGVTERQPWLLKP